MTPQLFVDIALAPALQLLPPMMDTPAARAMTIAICLQESRLKHRAQIGGPAHGYAQFEKGGGVVGVLTHRSSAPYAKLACETLDYPATADAVYVAIEHNDVLAMVFTRLLLWTIPHTLPARNNPAGGWTQYMAAWRPGKPHRATWDAFYEQAWSVVQP